MSTLSSCACDRVTARRLENRGLAWIGGAFLVCPCHLPLTLSLITMLFSGTAIASFVRGYAFVAATVTVVVWLAATVYGFRQLSAARRLRDSGEPS
jgi:hypothetical protein